MDIPLTSLISEDGLPRKRKKREMVELYVGLPPVDDSFLIYERNVGSLGISCVGLILCTFGWIKTSRHFKRCVLEHGFNQIRTSNIMPT